MDRELHEALKALAEIQKRQRLHTILLTSDLISGDVMAQVMGPHEHKTRVYRPLDGIPDGLASVLDACCCSRVHHFKKPVDRRTHAAFQISLPPYKTRVPQLRPSTCVAHILLLCTRFCSR